MRVGDPGVGELDAAQQVAEPCACRRPQPEGAVHVQPRAVLRGGRCDLFERVEGAGVDLARLRADDRRRVVRLQRVAEGTCIHPSLVVGGDRRRSAEPEQAERAVDRDVPLVAHEHAHARAAGEAVSGDVPACALEHPETRRRERGHAAHLRAGHEADRRVRRQSEQLAHPLAHDLFDHGRGRPAHVQAGVLVPGGREPVGPERCGQAAADDEPEIAAARHRDEPGVGGRGQLLDHLLGL